MLKDHNAMTPVRLEPAALRSRVKQSTTEPLRSHRPVHKILEASTLSSSKGSGETVQSTGMQEPSLLVYTIHGRQTKVKTFTGEHITSKQRRVNVEMTILRTSHQRSCGVVLTTDPKYTIRPCFNVLCQM